MDERFALFKVTINKRVSLVDALSVVNDLIKSPRMKETKTTRQFQNVPKSRFVAGSLIKAKQSKDVTYIIGHLKPKYVHLHGSGISDFLKKGYNKVADFLSPRVGFNNKAQRNLKSFGDKPITKIQVFRTPIMTIFDRLLNGFSLGAWNKVKKENNYDELFHLALIFTVGNKNVLVEKNDVINVDTNYKSSEATQIFDVPLKGSFTINQLLDKTRGIVGDVRFYRYSALNNNCQMFVKNVLESNGLYTTEANDFIYQPMDSIVKGLPGYVEKIANVVTDASAVVNKLTGQGDDEKMVKHVYKKYGLDGGSMKMLYDEHKLRGGSDNGFLDFVHGFLMPFKSLGALIPEIGVPLQMAANALDGVIPHGRGMKRKRGRPRKAICN